MLHTLGHGGLFTCPRLLPGTAYGVRPVQRRGSWSSPLSLESQLLLSSSKIRIEALDGRNEVNAPPYTPLAAPGDGSQRLNRVHIWSPTGDEDHPYSKATYRNATKEGLLQLLLPRGFKGLVEIDSDMIKDLKNMRYSKEIEFSLPQDMTFKDGGHYVEAYTTPPDIARIITLEGWQRSVTSGMESGAAERAVAALQAAGHRNVKRFCGKKVKSKDGRKVALEIDGAAVANQCALIVEVKSKLDLEAGKQLHKTIRKIRSLADRNLPALKPFKGKKLLGALSGHHVTNTVEDRAALLNLCKKEGYQIWLPNGAELGVGDGCLVSPSGSLCK